MDPYDSVAVSAVWKRVHASREKDDLEQELIEAIGDELRAKNAYLVMARRNPLFRQLAAEENSHAKKLAALYDLLFECAPRAQRQRLPKIDNFREALREAYRGEQLAAERYARLANTYPEHREFFTNLAAQERHHARQIHHLATKFL